MQNVLGARHHDAGDLNTDGNCVRHRGVDDPVRGVLKLLLADLKYVLPGHDDHQQRDHLLCDRLMDVMDDQLMCALRLNVSLDGLNLGDLMTDGQHLSHHGCCSGDLNLDDLRLNHHGLSLDAMNHRANLRHHVMKKMNLNYGHYLDVRQNGTMNYYLQAWLLLIHKGSNS